MATKKRVSKTWAALRTRALEFPNATEHFPWGERVVKVNGKVFVFLGREEGDEVSLSVKLAGSRELALTLPGCEPTGYGLGRAGWVTARFRLGKEPPLELLVAWVEESYRAVAPKRLVRLLDERASRREA